MAKKPSDSLVHKLHEAIDSHVANYSMVYEERGSGVNEILTYYIDVASYLLDNGFSESEIVDIYVGSAGNYLLLKKNHVSARSYACRLIGRKDIPSEA